MSDEEFINAEIDGRIDGGWGEVFEDFRKNHGHYPEGVETKQAAREWNRKNGRL